MKKASEQLLTSRVRQCPLALSSLPLAILFRSFAPGETRRDNTAATHAGVQHRSHITPDSARFASKPASAASLTAKSCGIGVFRLLWWIVS
jgi:hypothetical protein